MKKQNHFQKYKNYQNIFRNLYIKTDMKGKSHRVQIIKYYIYQKISYNCHGQLSKFNKRINLMLQKKIKMNKEERNKDKD